jgi:hypothetical protein
MPDWLTNGSDYGTLAKLMMVTESPYNSAGNEPDALPKSDMKQLTQVDNHGKYWPYPPGNWMAWIERSFRVPENIMDDTMDEDGAKTESLEYVHIGFAVDRGASLKPFAEWSDGAGAKRNLDKLGQRLVANLKPKLYTAAKKATTGVAVEDKLDQVPTDWEFRGRLWRMEKIMRIPYVVVKSAGDATGNLAYFLVGYEGAGGY